MAALRQSKTFATSFVVTQDVEDIATQIRHTAANTVTTSPLNVWFIGEAHDNDFDKRRRREVFDALADHPKIVLAVERSLVSVDDATNLVLENNGLKSKDDGRNKQIVGFLEEKLENTPNARTVVFLFGQEHEFLICQHLLRQLPATLGINWTSCLPIDMSLKDRLSYFPSLFSTVGKKPIGYCENNGNDYLLKLLEKGYVHDHFNLDLYSAEQIGSLFTKSIYAIYFKNDVYTSHQRRMIEREGTAAVAIRRINGAYTAAAKIIKKDDVPAAEKGTLSV